MRPPRSRCGCSTISRRSEEHTSELQSRLHLVCRLLLEKKKHLRRRRLHPPLLRSPCTTPSTECSANRRPVGQHSTAPHERLPRLGRDHDSLSCTLQCP